MTLYGLIFYLLGGIILAATLLAITSRNVMHAIVYLIVSFFGMAPVFYLLGAALAGPAGNHHLCRSYHGAVYLYRYDAQD